MLHPNKQPPQDFVIEGGYDPSIYQSLVQQGFLKKPASQLRDIITSLNNKFKLTTQEVDTISIAYQILSKDEGVYECVKRADHLVNSVRVVADHGPKTDERYHRCITVLKYAISFYTPSWYCNNSLLLLKLSTMPSYFGYSQELACQKTADLALKDLIDLNPDDLVIATREWIAFLIRDNQQIPQPMISLTNIFFEILDKKQLASQYRGEYCFLRGFMLHYHGKRDSETFQETVKYYTESINTSDQILGPTPALESGKYLTIFHFSKLLKYPEVFGFEKQWADTDEAEKLDTMKKELLQNKSAGYREEINRLMGSEGFRTQTASWLGYMMGQSDNLDENYVKAMLLINHVTSPTTPSFPFTTAQYARLKSWLYLYKPHLFQNPYQNSVTEITSSLEHYLTYLDGKSDNLERGYLEMAFKVIKHPMCQALPQVGRLREVLEVVRGKLGGAVAEVIEALENGEDEEMGGGAVGVK